MGDDGVN